MLVLIIIAIAVASVLFTTVVVVVVGGGVGGFKFICNFLSPAAKWKRANPCFCLSLFVYKLLYSLIAFVPLMGKKAQQTHKPLVHFSVFACIFNVRFACYTLRWRLFFCQNVKNQHFCVLVRGSLSIKTKQMQQKQHRRRKCVTN